MTSSARARRTHQLFRPLATILLLVCPFSYAASRNVAEAVVTGPGVMDVNDGTGREMEGGSPQMLLDRGTELLQKGNPKEAIRVLEAAFIGWQGESGTKDLHTAEAGTTAQRLGEALALEGDHGRSADFFTMAVGALEPLFGTESTQVVESMTGLGFALLRQGRASEAASALEGAVWSRVASQRSEDSVEGMPRTLGGLVEALVRRDSEGHGEQELEGALAAVDKMNLLAWRYFVQHRPYEGQTVMQKMLEGIETGEGGEASYPPASRDLVVSAYLYNLGFLRLAVLGEYQSAAEVLGRARSLRTPILGEVHALTVQAVVSRGHALTLTGDTTLAVDELTSTANALLEAGQAAAAERLARQALRAGYEPLGTHTYAHACFTQHLNMLKGWGSEGEKKSSDFQVRHVLIARKAQLSIRHREMVAASRTLAEALSVQIEEQGTPDLLKLSEADRELLLMEFSKIRNLVRNRKG
ncbi:unnamed protein product [Ascophyllum nodosum]